MLNIQVLNNISPLGLEKFSKENYLVSKSDENPDGILVRSAKLHDIENHVWISCGSKKVTALADEDLERSRDNKTSAVHFLRFQFNQDDVTQFLSHEKISVGVDHSEYSEQIELEPDVRSSLAKDLING